MEERGASACKSESLACYGSRMKKRIRLLAVATSLVVLPACPFLFGPPDDTSDAGPGDAGSDRSEQSVVEGSLVVTVRDASDAVTCQVTLDLPAMSGFDGLVTVLADTDETAFSVNLVLQGLAADRPTEPPVAMMQVVGRAAGLPDEPWPTGDATTMIDPDALTELSTVLGCNEDGTDEGFESGGVGALSTTTAAELRFEDLVVATSTSVATCPNVEIDGPCTVAEGSVRAVGAITFTQDSRTLDVEWDFTSEALWAVRDDA